MRPRGIVVALVIFVALLVTAPVALAANATEDAYCVGCSALHQKQVPFTGLDVALVVAGVRPLPVAVVASHRRGRRGESEGARGNGRQDPELHRGTSLRPSQPIVFEDHP